METARSGWGRRLRRGLLGLGLAGLLGVAGENLLLNFTLPVVLNPRGERLRISYALAFMLIPGRVHVLDLRVRGQGPLDQWVFRAAGASGAIDLSELWERSFHVRDLKTKGMSFRYRRRVAAGESTEGTPPIEDLSNPPDPDPDVIYPPPATPWRIALDNVEVEDIYEIWIDQLRLSGLAHATADVSMAGRYADVQARVTLAGMDGAMGDTRVVADMQGEANLTIESLDRWSPGPDQLGAISGRARLIAAIEDLRFLDAYLAPAPWLSLAGSGTGRLDIGLDHGQLERGSRMVADFPELLVRILSHDVSGAGRVRAAVRSDPDGVLESRLAIHFDDFTVIPDGMSGPLIRGVGFKIKAHSPDVVLDRPFTAGNVVIDLPESEVPDLTRFNPYLPGDIGLTIREGVGRVHGRLTASSDDSQAAGQLVVEANDAVFDFDGVAITGDGSLSAELVDARLASGWYDLSGTRLSLRRVGWVDPDRRHPGDGARGWYGDVVIPSGSIHMGLPIYLDALVELSLRDSDPVVALFTDPATVPEWARRALSVPLVRGAARLQLGPERLEVGPCRIRGGNYQVDLRFSRRGSASRGHLLARSGPLAFGVALRPQGSELQLFGAPRWFENLDSAYPLQ